MTRVAVLLACLLFTVAAPAVAQTVNPTATVFTPSSDHTAVVGGIPVLDHYQLDVMVGTASGALSFTKDIGKPNPNAQNEISVAIPEFASRSTGVYAATVSAVGPGGTGRSSAVPFVRISAPAAPTNLALQP